MDQQSDSIMEHIPTYPVLVRHDRHNDDIKTLIGYLRESWNVEDLVIKKFEGGLMNILYGCKQRSDAKEEDMILFRVYGDYEKPVVDREREILTNLILHKAGHGQPIYCKFTNGRAYRYYPGKVLNQNNINDCVERLIAREMANIQSIDCIQILKDLGMEEHIGTFTKEISGISHAEHLLDQVPEKFRDSSKKEMADAILNNNDGRKELDFLKPIVEKTKNSAGITHSDCVPQNIIYDESSDTVQIIDWEWSNWMSNSFDIGCYFTGLAAGFVIEIHKYPSKEKRHQFIKWYYERKLELRGEACYDVPTDILEEEDFKAQIHAMLYLLAGVFWAHKAADESVVDADYFELSKGFMELYQIIKKEIFVY